MTLSSLRSAKCSGLSEGKRGKTSPAGTVLTVGTVSAPYTAKKLRTVKKVPYEVYAVRRKQNMTMNRKIAKLYRTAYSTYRPYGIILQKNRFYAAGWTRASMPINPRTLRPPGR